MTNTMQGDDDEAPSAFSMEVGRRLRAIRKARQLSLDEVERKSGGRWSASAIGAYERGFRNLSLPRLRELAGFYGIPMAVLLGEPEQVDSPMPASKVVIDLEALGKLPEAAPISRYLRTIILERGDFNGRMLSIRRDDVRALCAVQHMAERDLFKRLQEWGVLISGGPE